MIARRGKARDRPAHTGGEDRFQLIFESSPIGVAVVGLDSRVIDVNPVFAALLGYEREELIGKSSVDYTHPDDIELSLRHVRQITEGDVPQGQFDKRYLRSNGSTVHARVTGTLVKDEKGTPLYLLAMAQDITEQRRVEAELKDREQEFRELYDGAPVGYHELNTQGRITRMNRTGLEMLGYESEDEVLGLFTWDLVEDGEMDRKALVDAVVAGGIEKRIVTRRYKRRDGSTFPAMGEGIALYDDAGRLKGFRTTVQDVTPLTTAEDRLRRLAEENSVLAEVGRVMSSSLDIDAVYEHFVEVTGKLIPFDLLVIGVTNEAGDRLVRAHAAGLDVPGMRPGTSVPIEQTVYGPPEFVAGGIILSGDEAGRLAAEWGGENLNVSAGLQTFIDVPLLSDDTLIGSLSVYSRRAGAYDQTHLALVQRIAAQVAGAVANSRLHAAVRRQATEREMLAEAARIMGSSLDIDTVYERFADVISRLIPFDLLVIALLDEEENKVTVAHMAGIEVPGLERGMIRNAERSVFSLPDFKSHGSLRTGEDADAVTRALGAENFVRKSGIETFLDVPLLSNDRVIGALGVMSFQRDAYTDSAVALAQRIAAQVAGAIANANLHAASKRDAAEREMLAEIGRIVSASLDVEEVYEPLADALQKLIPFDRLNVVSID